MGVGHPGREEHLKSNAPVAIQTKVCASQTSFQRKPSGPLRRLGEESPPIHVQTNKPCSNFKVKLLQMKLEELITLAREQERLTIEFQNLMKAFEEHPMLALIDPSTSDIFQSLEHSRAVSQQAIEQRDQMGAVLQEFNVRLEANVKYLQRVLKEFEDQDEDV